MLDLARWADGGYRVPGEPFAEPAEGDEEKEKDHTRGRSGRDR